MISLWFTFLTVFQACVVLGLTKVTLNVRSMLAKQREFPGDTLNRAVSKCCQDVAQLNAEVLRLQLMLDAVKKSPQRCHDPRASQVKKQVRPRTRSQIKKQAFKTYPINS
ncbi:hypothetical protein LZ30DRAFT_363766 [Colletotrichum cereale]|nr:hypothetical protein LZ30DRAFT_363766 [Colletotrichum cereale]